MEGKVSRTTDVIRKAGVASVLSLAIAAMPTPVLAGGGGGAGLATEMTQLANHLELVLQLAQQVDTAIHTLDTVHRLDTVLTNVDPKVLAEIAGIPASDFDQLYALSNRLNSVLDAYKSLAQNMQDFQKGVELTGLSPSQYLAAQAQAAQQYGGFYKKVFESEQQSLQRALEEQSALSGDLARIDTNKGVVDSIKQMSGQLVQARSTLLSMLQQMQQANMLVAAQRASDGYAAQEAAKRDLQKYTNYMQAQQQSQQNGTLPDPTKIQLNQGTRP